MPTAVSQRGSRAQASPDGAGRRPAAAARPARGRGDGRQEEHELSISVQVDQIAEAVTGTITQVGKALTAKGGLPLYLGLGLLAAADVIAWPVAAAAGVGYAVLRRWNPFGGPGAKDRKSVV